MDNLNKEDLLFTFSLIIAFFSSFIPGIITGLLLIDISQSFNSNIGYVSQIRSISAILGVVAAILIGVLSVRYQPKHLILVGLGLMLLVGVGCGTVSTLGALFVVYSFQGLAVGIMSPMVNMMIGQHLAQEKQAKTMGYLIASVSLSYFVSSPIISYLNNNHGWRSAFIYYQLPLAFVSLLVAYKYLPILKMDVTRGSSYREGLGLIRGSSSALACLFGVLLGAVCWQSYLSYSTSFLRDVFGISVYTASLVMILTSGSFTVGSVLSGGLCNRFGKKMVTVVGTLLLAVFTVLFSFSPSFILGVVIGCVGFFFGGLRVPGANGFALDQIPEYRGIMMSLSTGFVNVGNFIGTAVGGYILDVYGWGVQGLILGVFGLVGSLIYQLYSQEKPNR